MFVEGRAPSALKKVVEIINALFDADDWQRLLDEHAGLLGRRNLAG
jgi:hypothetical protein